MKSYRVKKCSSLTVSHTCSKTNSTRVFVDFPPDTLSHLFIVYSLTDDHIPHKFLIMGYDLKPVLALLFVHTDAKFTFLH